MKKRILISAYAISPVRGSEYGAAWNTVINLASQHELWVLYGMSDDHMGDTQTMLEYIKNNKIKNIHFVEVQASRLAMAINVLNKIGMGWCFYLAYYLWQKAALNAAFEVCKTVDIDVVHQLGPIGFREPGFLWKLGKPLVWGPIGGMNVINDDFLAVKPIATRLKYSIKNLINYVQLNHSARIKDAFERADVLIAATTTGQQNIWEKFGIESSYLPEQGIIGDMMLNEQKFDTIGQQVKLVWSGSLIERKSLIMCLEALSGIKHQNWVLHVLGTGPLEKKLRQKATEFGIDNHIKWHGHLPRNNAVNIMANAHLHIITSMAEDNPAVIFEALTFGVPTLTIDHCGMGDVICHKCGIKIKLGNYASMLVHMRSELIKVLETPSTLIALAQTTTICAEEHAWDKKLVKLNNIYNKAIQAHQQRIDSPLIYQTLTA
jgi:glycosyltransferase involved in cell wall biosynthesis